MADRKQAAMPRTKILRNKVTKEEKDALEGRKLLQNIKPNKRDGVEVRIKNAGINPRVVYAINSRPVRIEIGQSVVVEITRREAMNIIRRRERGGDLVILDPSVPERVERVRVKPSTDDRKKGFGRKPQGTDPIRPDINTIPALLHVMGSGDPLSYQHFLSVATRLLPANTLPPRPKREQILQALADHNAKD